MTDDMNNPTPNRAEGDESFAWTGSDANGNGPSGGTGPAAGAAATGREWLTQLQSMIENAATQAAPVLKEVAAKAAELAAIAGDKAGPVAAKAADMTAQAGQRIAERSRDFAADLRRDHPADDATAASTDDAASSDAPAPHG